MKSSELFWFYLDLHFLLFWTLCLIINKYQGVKEFHMLAHIGCYGNIMVFSPFKVKDDILSSTKSMVARGQPMVTKDKE